MLTQTSIQQQTYESATAQQQEQGICEEGGEAFVQAVVPALMCQISIQNVEWVSNCEGGTFTTLLSSADCSFIQPFYSKFS